ncbi:prolyl-tRNA editing protein ProX [bacterium BMS3Bbin10]|nr:prolyl-tRNA editing protein ProX [bacterium BMS3Bbin10]HDL16472.1 prolyl-tRNA synthetase associated domain-containing protein [Hyphomicrobiales bacterium]
MEKPPATRAQLLSRLRALGIDAATVEHPPLFTVEESRALRGEIPGAHTKNLFLKCKKGTLWLVVALENAVIDLKRLHVKLGSGRLSFGRAELLREVLGVPPGSVTPFSLINDTRQRVSVVLDAEMMNSGVLNFHPLVNTATTTIARDDLLAFIRDCGHDPAILAVSGQGDGSAAEFAAS